MAQKSTRGAALEPSIGPVLGSDLPEVHPHRDAFGYASFAQAIARAARTTPSPAGLVMAIDGPWGAGKTTLLNFVEHYLGEPKEGAALAAEDKPVVIRFNPWWFADGQQLARQFLQQFAAQLPNDEGRFDGLRTAIAGYADAIGEAASWGASLKLGVKSRLIRDVVAALVRSLLPKEKDIAALKRNVAASLREFRRRFVVVVDDIDRLRPDEINEVFRVVKAIADFPNVVYLLAFDSTVVSQAIETSMGLVDGRAYMEKIVQAPFVLPVVPRAKLLRKLADDLDNLLARIGAVEFDQDRWVNVFHEGLDHLVRRPRDIVRIINALFVTLPPMRGEVNVVDFIALEFLRTFAPTTYRAIRENKERFVGGAGRARENRDVGGEQQFHSQWIEDVPHEQQHAIRNIVRRLFPRLQRAWDNVEYDASEVRRWSAAARIAAPDHYPKYFEFSVPEDTVSRAELRALIALGDDGDAIENEWRAAMGTRRTDGETKADDLIRMLIERDDLDTIFARTCLTAVLRIADAFVGDPANRPRGFFGVPPYSRMYWLINHLVARLPAETREDAFLNLIRASSSVTMLCHLATSIEAMNRPDSERRESVFQGFSAPTVAAIVELALARIRQGVQNRRLLDEPDLLFFLHRWSAWGSEQEVQAWVRGLVEDDRGLLSLLRRAIRVSTVQDFSEAFARHVESINPGDLELFIDASAREFTSRVDQVGARNDLGEDDRRAIELFRAGLARSSTNRGSGAPEPALI